MFCFCRGWDYSEAQMFYLSRIDDRTIQLFYCKNETRRQKSYAEMRDNVATG